MNMRSQASNRSLLPFVGQGFTLLVPTGAYVSWMGTRLDGRGLNPEIAVDWSYDASLQERDLQLITPYLRSLLKNLSVGLSFRDRRWPCLRSLKPVQRGIR